LEGAELAGYSSVLIGGIRDPFIVSRLDDWLGAVREKIEKAVASFGPEADEYSLAIHTYGLNAVMGAAEPHPDHLPNEVGLVVEILAPTQEFASEVARVCRFALLHHPVPEWTGGITTLACLHNPAHIERGAVYEFNLHHVVLPEDPMEMFRIRMLELPSSELGREGTPE
jgi:hypothetical protein